MPRRLSLLLMVLFLAACASREDTDFYFANRDQYVLVQSLTRDRQRFEYILNPAIEVHAHGSTVELWKHDSKIDTIKGVTSITMGPVR